MRILNALERLQRENNLRMQYLTNDDKQLLLNNRFQLRRLPRFEEERLMSQYITQYLIERNEKREAGHVRVEEREKSLAELAVEFFYRAAWALVLVFLHSLLMSGTVLSPLIVTGSDFLLLVGAVLAFYLFADCAGVYTLARQELKMQLGTVLAALLYLGVFLWLKPRTDMLQLFSVPTEVYFLMVVLSLAFARLLYNRYWNQLAEREQ